MAYVNGGTSQDSPHSVAVEAASAGDNNQAVDVSSERRQKIQEMLSEPFDVSDIKWRVTATSIHQTRNGPQKRGRLVAYADQRAYTDRLNAVFGEWGWTRHYDVQVVQNFERRAPGDKTKTIVAAKVVVVSKVTIHSLGSHTGVGEEWADDENAATRAEAQAFKRACACFGLGRYLYDLDTVWVDLDQNNRPARTLNLPDWALPGNARGKIQPGIRQNSRQPQQNLMREDMLASIRALREKVGSGLSVSILNNYAAGAEPETLRHAELTILLEKLIDVGNGIDRLQRAIAIVGEARYATICRELNCAGESINDIPDRDTLRRLLARVEEEASGKNGGHPNGRPQSIGDARGRLLQSARKMADKTGRQLAQIIAEASDGKLSLEGLRNLTDADVPLLLAALSRMV